MKRYRHFEISVQFQTCEEMVELLQELRRRGYEVEVASCRDYIWEEREDDDER